jgi:hypothetical protein
MSAQPEEAPAPLAPAAALLLARLGADRRAGTWVPVRMREASSP